MPRPRIVFLELAGAYTGLELFIQFLERKFNIITNLQGQTSMIDWAALIDKVPELAMVIIVVFYTLELSKVHRASVADLMSSGHATSEKVMKDWREYMQREEERWREFVREMKDSHNAALGRLAEEIKEGSKAIAIASETIVRHEAKVDQAIMNILSSKK